MEEKESTCDRVFSAVDSSSTPEVKMVDAAAGQVPPPFVFSPTACLTTDHRLTSVTPNPLTPSQAAVAKRRWRAPHPPRPPRTLLRHVDHARGASVHMLCSIR